MKWLRSRWSHRLFFIMFERLRRGVFRGLQVLHLRSVPSPHHAMIELTHVCNLKCTMCHRSVFKDLTSHNLSLETFERILQQLPRVKTILFLGVGEPFCNPDLPAILDTLARRGGSAHLTTNGTLMNEQNIKKLGRGLFCVTVSIDSPVAETYERVRVGARLSSVLENLRTLKVQRPDLLTSVLLVMMRDNIQDLPKMVELVRSLDVDYLVHQHMFALDRESGRRHISWIPDVESSLAATRQAARKQGVILDIRPPHPAQRPCLEPWLKPNITMNGDIYPCCFIYKQSENYPEWYMGQELMVPMDNYRMGNLFEQPFATIWNSSAYRMLREKVLGLPVRPRELSVEELNTRRRQVKKNHRFWYCDVCLYRWSAAC